MSFNLVDLVMHQLGGNNIGRIASLLGLETSKAQSAVGAAVPALLAGIAGAASEPDGARRLMDAVSRADTSVVDDFSSALSGQGTQLASSGASMLSSLLGNNSFSGIVNALSRYTGLGQSSINALVGMLSPLVLGVVGKQAKSLALDATGLSSLFKGQQSNIVNSLPGGLGSMLGAVPGLGSFFQGGANAFDSAKETAHDTYRAAATTVRNARVEPVRGPNLAKWLVPLAAALALGFILYYATRPRQTTTIAPAAATNTVRTDITQTFTTQLHEVRDTLTTTLGDIKDAASAEAALPRLQSLNTQLETLKTSWGNLPSASRSTLSSTVDALTTTFRSGYDRVLAIPGISDKLRPVLDQIMGNLRGLGV